MRACNSVVIDVASIEEGNIGIVLDKTVFFPRGGGAAGDIGHINGVPVLETIAVKDSGRVIHPVRIVEAGDRFDVGLSVRCEIDWGRRYRIMRLHAASHIMEHFLFSLVPGLELAGTNVNENRDSSTYIGPEITRETVNNVTQLVNEFVEKNYEIRTYPSKENDWYRFWEAGSIVIPCGGVHPRLTSDIGRVCITKEKGGKRQKIRTELETP
jgi:Ser-tRNA(Ala) deacylase AlaX